MMQAELSQEKQLRLFKERKKTPQTARKGCDKKNDIFISKIFWFSYA